MPINIWFRYPGSKAEIIDTAANAKEAEDYLREYRMAFREGALWLGKRSDETKHTPETIFPLRTGR